MAQIVGLDSFINIGHFGKAAVSSLDFFDSPLSVASKLLTSAPAEKALPAPVITIDPIHVINPRIDWINPFQILIKTNKKIIINKI